MSFMTFLGDIMSSTFSNLKSTFMIPCAFLVSISVKSMFRKSFCLLSGISVINSSGMLDGFSSVYSTFCVLALKKEYTTGSNLSRNSSKFLTRSLRWISFIVSSSRLSRSLASPIMVRRLSFSGLISSKSMVRFVCVITSIVFLPFSCV